MPRADQSLFFQQLAGTRLSQPYGVKCCPFAASWSLTEGDRLSLCFTVKRCLLAAGRPPETFGDTRRFLTAEAGFRVEAMVEEEDKPRPEIGRESGTATPLPRKR